MAQPIAVAENIAFAFPDVCLTPAPSAPPVPIPYPNIAQLSAATPTSATGGSPVLAGGKAILLASSEVPNSSGDEAGVNGGVTSKGKNMGPCTMTSFSTTVFINGEGVVRFGDSTSQNNSAGIGNCFGTVLSALPSVFVGG